jgi:hypothetical protein
MGKSSVKIGFLVICSLILTIGLFACAQNASLVREHPVEVTGMPICGDCHTDGRASLNHTSQYITQHQFYASQNSQMCGVCHKESFCSDCHAHKEEIKPSEKFKDSPERSLPHRGDYLNQHKIDGRIDPASCMKCHGRQNNERCRECHR